LAQWRRSVRNVFGVRIAWALAIFAFLDLVCVGLGMGVPIFCILFGFPVGWYIARRVIARRLQVARMLGKVLEGAVLTSAFTFVVMDLVWGRCVVMLFDPLADLANFGIPLVLYEPRASFIGWLVLMMAVSPFLQLLMTLFGAHVTLLWWLGKRAGMAEEGGGPA
jgi:hypothetical protein